MSKQRYSWLKPFFLFICLFNGYFTFFQLQAEVTQEKKIALLFLTRNGVNHPNLWKTLLAQNPDKFNIYIYSDYPLKDPFYESFRIQESVPTSWTYHIKTWQLLVREAFKNPENYKFVYLSESCIPLAKLERIYQTLTANNSSYMCYLNTWWPKDNPREVVELPVEHRWGNHEWVILNRRHAEMIVNDQSVIDIVSRCSIDSESYPSTLFSVHGCLNEFACYPTTYVNWDITEGGGAHPYSFKEYNIFNWYLLVKAKKDGHLFARKFTANFPEEGILKIMHSVFNDEL